MTVGVVSLGCAKNRVDTEQMLAVIVEAGYRITPDAEDAEILLVNTCGFIDPAKQESIDMILEMAEHKKTGRCRLLIAAGCLVQRYCDDLFTGLPEVDLFIGVSDYPLLPALIERALAGERLTSCQRSLGVLSGGRILTTPPFRAFVRTGDGCDNRCSYCAIPDIRGAYRSRPFDEIVAEIETLAGQGVREITLIAQDTTRFERLPQLIQTACLADGIDWVRVLYAYPSRVTEALLDVLSSEPKACPYLDIPLQHIDPALLLSMHRTGTPSDIRRLITAARDRDLTLRTTFIVGYPGETDDAFRRLCDFVEEIRFDRMGAFAFSPEEGTPAAALPHAVPEEVKKERLDTLMRLQQPISLSLNQTRIGERTHALIERVEPARLVARTQREAPDDDGLLFLALHAGLKAGDLVPITVTRADVYDLYGEVCL